MTRICVYDVDSIKELVVPHFTMSACRRYVEREYPKYGHVVTMCYEAIGKIGVVQMKTTNITLVFFGVAVEYVQDRGIPI
jgi:hypothetical protein